MCSFAPVHARACPSCCSAMRVPLSKKTNHGARFAKAAISSHLADVSLITTILVLCRLGGQADVGVVCFFEASASKV